MMKVYLDHAATTPLDKRVLKAMTPCLTSVYGNPASLHFAGREALRALDAARDRVAELLGAEPSEVYFTSSGSEADNWAMKCAARAVRRSTGRDKIVKFEGCYHGHSDGLLVRAGSGCLTGGAPDSLGVPASFARETLVAPYNDLSAVQALFAAHPAGIACVIVEPVAANMGVIPPAPGFLQGLRSLCSEYGALLIFDEVITGFRVAYGGAAQLYGVAPDLAAYGKIVGGGMPLAAYGGRADAMAQVAPLGKVYQAGTLSGNPVATAAGLATLRILREQKDTLYPSLEQKGKKLEEAFREEGIPVNCVGSLLSPFFTKKPPQTFADVAASDLSAFSVYFRRMLSCGQYVAPSQFEAMFLSAAHTKMHLAGTCASIREGCCAALEYMERRKK